MLSCAENARRRRSKVKKKSLSLRTVRIPLLTAILLFFLDQGFKFLFYHKEIISKKTVIIKGLLYLVPAIKNPGIAFGLFRNYGHFLLIPAFLAVIFILFIYYKTSEEETLLKWGLLLILTGALSNLVDRLLYNGSVIDYLLLRYFPYSFNLADPSILVGVGLVIGRLLRKSTDF